MRAAAAAAGSSGGAAANVLSAEDERYMERYERLRGILGGTTPITLHLEFLYSHNRADLQVCEGELPCCCRACRLFGVPKSLLGITL